MGRKKATDQIDLLVHPLIIRVDNKTFKKLERLMKESGCRSLGEVARKILSNERINCFYRDDSLSAPMEEFALIRKEIKAIGVNINQQTRYFNACKSSSEKTFYAMKTSGLYKGIDLKIEALLNLISELAIKWLPKS
ncbi:mobilization protein [Pedobacter aquatilis]|uniref:mobilization protein n=1 Tax=Pedobacter aquatilis TaxID=351343 RepID=UPI00293077A3|nr:mobilization protein [Pedobacter aquatilis]